MNEADASHDGRGSARRRVAVILTLTVVVALAALALVRLSTWHEVPGGLAWKITEASAVEAGRAYPKAPPPVEAGRAASLPETWDATRPQYVGYVWYQLRLPVPLPRLERPVLYLPVAGMNAEVWHNGGRVGGAGRMQPSVSRHFYVPQLIDLPSDLQASDAVWVLVAGVVGHRSSVDAPWLGEHAALYEAWRLRTLWQGQGTAFTAVLNLALAVFVLALWWRDRSHTAYAWFGAAALVWALRSLDHVLTEAPVTHLLVRQLTLGAAACFNALFAIFAQRLEESFEPARFGPRWLPPAALSYAAATSVFFVVAWTYRQATVGFVMAAAVGVALTTWSAWRLARLALARPEPALVAVAASAALYVVLLLNDFATALRYRPAGEIYVRQYAALPMFLAITAALGQRYLQALQQARELAASLQQSFARLRQAEQDQARAEERARLMGDLHDGLGLHLATALRQARTDETPREQLIGSLQDCMDDLRLAIDSLDEQERDPLALLGSLRYRMGPRFEAMGLTLKWRVGYALGELPALDAAQALDLLRLVQEALANVLRHSGATEVTMALDAMPDGARIVVADNGRGFDVGSAASGRGLGHMRSRAGRLGARLEWRSDLHGTRVELLAPWTGAGRTRGEPRPGADDFTAEGPATVTVALLSPPLPGSPGLETPAR